MGILWSSQADMKNYPKCPFSLWISSLTIPHNKDDHKSWFAWTVPLFACCLNLIISSVFFHSQKYPSLNNTLYDHCTHNSFQEPLWDTSLFFILLYYTDMS